MPVNKVQYSEIRDYLVKPVKPIMNLVDEQIECLKREIRNLWDKVHHLEMELMGWKFSKGLSEKVIKRLEANRDDLLEELKHGENKFRPIWKVPSDVWSRIFGYYIQNALDGYLKENPKNLGMRPPIFNLSQVCQYWRYLIHNDTKAWRLVYIAPNRVWRQDEQEFITKSLQKASMPITVLTNISQQFRWNDDNHRYDQNGSYLSGVSPNESTVFSGKEYTLLVNMSSNNYSYMERLSQIPLSQTSSLVFHGQCNFQNNNPFNYVSKFSRVKAFAIINETLSSLPNITISSYFPELREVTLQMKQFPSRFNLRGYLPTNIQELRLRNDGGGSLPVMSSDVELPHLRALEITTPGSYLLDRLTARALQSLTLYAPHDSTSIQLSSSNRTTRIYNQLLHLKFEDWKNQDVGHGVTALCRDLVDKVPLLCTLTFSRCFIYGKTLISTIETRISESGDLMKHNSLREITLGYPTGITNAQCEELKKLVKSVKIYM